MRLKLIIFTAVSLFATSVIAQDKKGQLVGVQFNLVDFKGVTSFNTPTSGKGYSSFRNMAKGVSLTYWKGITSKIDLNGKLNAIFYDYSAINQGISGKKEIGLELEPTINIRPFTDAARLAPFLTAGVGLGLYNDKIGSYVPVGGGLQLNFQKETYIFVQAQYKFTLTKKVLGDNLFYSIGFAQKI